MKVLNKKKEDFDKCNKNFKKFKKDVSSVLEEIRYRNRINTSL
jgi:peptidoglycan hydrolase CwlO-like protein